jgi:putative phosphoesterase
MRVCILSDTHGEIDARIVELAARADLVIHGGDVGARRVIDALSRRSPARLVVVRGNNDVPAKWPAGEQAALQALPLRREVELPGGVIAVEHGHHANPAGRRHARLRERYPHARAVVYGHSHRLVCDTAESPWVLNPGAAGRSRTFGGPSCLVLHAGSRESWRLETHRFPLSG